jgi:SHS2 domain-containing protein
VPWNQHLTTGEGYKFLEHITDAYIEAWAPSMERAFSKAAEAFFDTMLNVTKVDPKIMETLNVEGHDELELLYNWLEALLLQFDIQGTVYREFDLSPIDINSRPLKLEARIRGEQYAPEKHGAKTEVKGVTYHLMNINKQSNEVRLQFLLDL